MAKNLLFAVFLLWYTNFSYAQTIKTDVLVIGGTPSGVAAAMQSARSKLKTILIMPGAFLDKAMPAGNNYVIKTNENLSSGIWGEFRDKVRAFYKTTPGYDTTYNAPLKFESFTGAAILKSIADTVKNLTIKLNTPFTTVKKDGNGWEVSITTHGKTNVIKTKVLVDATQTGEVVNIVGPITSVDINPFFNPFPDDNDLYRTSIAVGDYAERISSSGGGIGLLKKQFGYAIPIKYTVANNVENMLLTGKIIYPDPGIAYLPTQLTLGQGVGCIAAYCAFFKTTTKKLSPRIIQQEMLDFKGLLLPFTDVKPNDKYIRAIQQIGATGLLKGIRKGNDLLFIPDTTITTAEIKPILNEIYSRAFIWFDKEKPGEKFTVGNTASLISEFTLTESKTLQSTLQKDWQAKYGFANFEPSRPITRLEFAVLVNQYLNPFARKIDLEGNIVN
jgi:hypothetical protein